MKSQTYQPLVDQMLRPLGLMSVYEYVAANNPANALPYHNLFHAQCMVLTCQRAARAQELSEFDRKALAVAPLFHDYAHSGGTRPDAENIRAAKAALEAAAAVLGLSDALMVRSLELIDSTQYPYVREARDESELIIRDADMCQLLYGHWFEQVFQGLRAEMAYSRGEMTLGEFCVLQRSFLPAIELHSRWGREIQASLRTVALAKCAMAERVAGLMVKHNVSELAAYELVKANLSAVPASAR